MGFIDQHSLWTEEQKKQAAEIGKRIKAERLTLIRLAWADSHGYSRAKSLTPASFATALKDGYNVNVAPTTLDSGNARTFRSFSRGGGLGLDEMTGSPNITVVPDPATFRVLPWAAGIGWVLCDEYFKSGDEYPFSTRRMLKKQLDRLAALDLRLVAGLEVELYLAGVAQQQLREENISTPGFPGRPLETFAPEPGYSYHSESKKDLMQPLLSELAECLQKLDLPLRSIENEWGPGQMEFTFSERGALEAMDNMVLFRTATKQICRRRGYLASFMCRPALKGYYSSGWHLHQSVVDSNTGRNRFEPHQEGAALSRLGRSFLAGLLEHAASSCAFTTPTVNGYRRFKPNSLAPDRATWGCDNRGAMIRVLGGVGDPASRLENRVGEPAANPYLYMISQVVSGLDGIERDLDPGPEDLEPYRADRPRLPTDLMSALDLLEQNVLFRDQCGEVFFNYFLKLKRNEAGRFLKYIEENGIEDSLEKVTDWEQNEYFDFF